MWKSSLLPTYLCLLPTSCLQLLCVLLWYNNEAIVFVAGFITRWQKNHAFFAALAHYVTRR